MNINNKYQAIIKAHQITDENIIPKVQHYVRADVEFGQPSKNCSGLGICRINLMYADTYSAAKNCQCNSARTIISVTNSKRLRFTFVKNEIDDRVLDQYFGGYSFTVLEDINIPKPIIQKFDLKYDLIKYGNYLIIESKHFLTILFP